MARARNIKPGLFRNEILGVADPLYTILFQGLWVIADRSGRLEDRPVRIKGDVFPYRDGVNVDEMLNWLHKHGFIMRYAVDGKRYILVVEFLRHQNPHKNEALSEIPEPAPEDSSNGASAPDFVRSTPADSLFSDSLIPSSLIPDSGFSDSRAPEPPAPPPKKVHTLTVQDLMAEGVGRCHAEDWLKVRKEKKAPLTRTAWDGVREEAGRAGVTIAEAVKIAAENSWQGFKASWLRPGARGSPGVEARNAEIIRLMGGKTGEVIDAK